jgi:two-component system sensor histidine kinase/response regulator
MIAVPASAATPPVSTTELLLVDDNPADLRLLAAMLKRANYQIRIAQTGKIALQSIQQRRPDLILLDVQLPDISGYEVCRQMRACTANANLPIIFISALDQAAEKVKAFTAGGVDYIAKPYQAAEVLARVQLHLQTQRYEQQLQAQNQALRAQEERWTLLMQGTGDGIFDWDIAAGVATLSDRFKTMLGYGVADFPATVQSWVHLLHPDDRAPARAAVTAYLQRQSPNYAMEYRLRCRDGRYKWVQVRGQATWGADGTPLRLVGVHQDISDRKRAELDLKTRDERLLKLAAQIPGVIYQYRRYPDGRSCFPFASEAIHTIYEVTPEQVRDSDEILLSRLHPDDIERITTSIDASADQLSPWHCEYRVNLPQRGLRWLEGNAQPAPLPDGSILWHGFIHDISDRKAAEAQRQASEATQRAMLSAIPDLLVRVQADGIMLDCLNRGDMTSIIDMAVFEAHHGRPPHMTDFMPQREAAQRMDAIQQAIATGEMQRYRHQLTINGQVRHEESRIMPINDREVLVMVRDISDRVQAEQQARERFLQEQAIAKITGLVHGSLDLVTLLRQAVVAVWDLMHCDRVVIYRFNPDWSGEIVAESVTPGWTSLLDQPSPELRSALNQDHCLAQAVSSGGRTLQDTYLQEQQGQWHPQDYGVRQVADVNAAHFPPCYRNLLDQIQAQAYLILPIYRDQALWGLLCVYQNDGPRQWQPGEIRVLTQAAIQLGLAVQKAALFQQIQQTSEELRAARDVAEAANRAKSTFLANMSHELRTPLNAILGFTQVLAQDRSLSPAHQQSLNTILRSGEHLLDLINDVLDLSKIEAGRTEVQVSAFGLQDFLRSLHAMLAQQARNKGLQWQLDLATDLPQQVVTDAGKLRQILINLLGNAIKFTSVGGVTLRVYAQLSDRGPEDLPMALSPHGQPLHLVCEVIDTGVGIAVGEQDRIFNAFEQTATGKITPHGTGLGLTISRRFVEMLGGQLMLCSEPGQGSIFRIMLPVLTAATPPLGLSAPQPLPDRPILGLSPGQPQYRILVVDDEAVNRQVVLQMLRPLGFAVAEAEDGQAALSQWQHWSPHLILMDMRMAAPDGYDTTRAIRQREAQRQTQAAVQRDPVVIVAVTAAVLGIDQERAIAVGCDDYLSKPVQLPQLLKCLAQRLQVRYDYAPVADSAMPKELTVPLLASDLAAMPQPWVEALQAAALRCDDLAIEQLIDQIPPHQAILSQALRQHVQQFQLERILALTEGYLARA